MIGYFAEKIS